MKTRILIISSRADFGGGPEHIFKLTKYLSGYFDFYYAVPADFPYYKRYSDLVGSDRIINIPHRKFTFLSFVKLIRFARNKKINIIHSHGKGAGIYSRLTGLFLNAKIIHTFHGIHVGNYNPVQKFLYLTLERFLSFTTDRFISVSPGENELIKKYKITSAEKTTLIENGVEIPQNTVPEINFIQTPRIIITFTRFDYAKNTELIIPVLLQLRELSRLSEFSFRIYGEGPLKEHIGQLVTKYGLNEYVQFKGTTTETSELFLNSFCYLSTSRWEGLPLGILEAFAYGLPVIATDVVGNNNVIDNGINGILYKPDYPEQAAEDMIKLTENKNYWLNISKNARLKAENYFNIQIMTSKTKELYLNVIGSQSN